MDLTVALGTVVLEVELASFQGDGAGLLQILLHFDFRKTFKSRLAFKQVQP
jgi:hypothetical protein